MWDATLRRMTVLIVDDQEANVFLLERILARAGYIELVSTTDPRRALPLFRERQPDLVLLDLHMPHLDGFAVLEQLTAETSPASYLPILVLTADITPEVKQRALASGAKDFLIKPFDPSEVVIRTANLLETRLLYRRLQDQNLALDEQVQARTQALEQALGELRQSEERFRSLVQNASDVIAILNATGAIRYLSPSVERLLGQDASSLTGQALATFIHPDDTPYVRERLATLAEADGTQAVIELRLRHGDGTWRLLEVIATNLLREPSVRGIVFNARDITERRRFEDQLRRQAFYDPLTELPNRALFLDRLEQALSRASRRKGQLALFFLDLDRFKLVNDSLGHAAGDELLVSVSQRLSTSLRPGDTFARFGGDEFTILLEELDGAGDAMDVAHRLLALFEAPFAFLEHEVYISASIGIALYTPDYTQASDLLRDADAALARAKAAGREGFVIFDTSMNTEAVARLALETSLRRALERGELRLHYQPIVELRTGAIVKVEALVRWQHPERGLVMPGEFIPLAEETGLILPIGRWVLNEACHQARTWQSWLAEHRPADPPLVMSVNLSARQFRQPDLVAQVTRAIAESGIDPATLELEITESMIMGDVEAALTVLRALKATGLRLAIDDFGTGYSSLSYLRRFPVDTLKVDRSFITELEEDRTAAAIVQTIATLATTLALEVTVEGIETAAQGTRLASLGCQRGQGYYFSRPVASCDLTVVLQRGSAPGPLVETADAASPDYSRGLGTLEHNEAPTGY